MIFILFFHQTLFYFILVLCFLLTVFILYIFLRCEGFDKTLEIKC
jgi:hypothetical protein